MDLEQYLEPLDDPAPGGEDLYGAGEIMALDMLAKWGSPEEEPDWKALRDACSAALERSRDLRPAAYLAAALLHTDGVRAFCSAMGLLRSLLDTMWDDVHPPLDEDGDAMERANAVFNLTNFHRVLKPLRAAPLVEDRVAGRFSLLHVELAEGKAEPPQDFDGEVPQLTLIEGAFRAMDPELRDGLAADVRQGVDDVAGIESAFRERVGAEQAPDLSRLREGLQRISHVLGQYAGEGGMDDSQPAAEAESAGSASAASPAAALPGEIRSRQDAIAAMDRISAYFRAHEPSSPVPLLMSRAKRLVDMDFLDILEDVAPDAVDQVRKLGGVETNE